MCGRHECCREPVAETDRQKLERAIERLSKRQWCEDATLALDAARKHLETLPKSDRWALRSDHGVDEYESYAAAVKAGMRALECGAATVSISKVSR